MQNNLDTEHWRQVVVSSITELGTNVVRFLPNLIGTLALLVLGWLVSKLAEIVARRVLHKFGVDKATATTRVPDTLKRAGLGAAPSRIFARLLFWTLMLIFVLSAVEALGLTAVNATIDRVIGFITNLFAAGLIVVFGLLLGRFARNVAGSAATAANMARADRVGAVVGGLVVLFVAVLALEQLGVETVLLVTVLTVVSAAASLTIGISFALGARPVVSHILAGHFLRQSLPPGSKVEVRGEKGTVERVGPVDTLVRAGERSWSIPNGALIEETVMR